MSNDWSTHPPVIGMDTNSFGFHVVSSVPVMMPGAEDDVLDLGEIEYGWALSSAKDFYDRLRVAHHLAIEWFKSLPAGSSVWCEEALVLPKNIETTRKLVMMSGVLYAAFMEARPDATWFWISLSQWRKAVLGKGSGRKDEMKELAKLYVHTSRFGMERLSDRASVMDDDQREVVRQQMAVWDSQADLYDAYCIMEYGRQQLAAGAVQLR